MSEKGILKESASTDPVQNELRNLKKEWNKEVSVLIAQFIAMKRGINGKGDPKAGLPPSDIKDPIPDTITSYLDNMINRFHAITDGAKDIIREQAEYSANRRKSLKESSVEYNISKYGSNVLTRLWTFVSQYPLFSDENITKKKIRLLNAISDFKDQINDVEYVLTSSDKQALAHSFYNYINLLNLFKHQFQKKYDEILDLQINSFAKKVNSGEKLPEIQVEEEPKKIETSVAEENIDDLKNIRKHISKELSNIFPIIAKMKTLSELNKVQGFDFDSLSKISNEAKLVSEKLLSVNDLTALKEGVDNLKGLYNNILSIITPVLGMKDGSTLEQALKKIINIEKVSYDVVMQKIANKNIQRWFKRLNLGIFPDELDRSKLDTAKDLNSLSILIDEIMNLLEKKDIPLTEISRKVISMYEMLAKICEHFSYLGKYYNYNAQKERSLGSKEKNLLINESYINFMAKAKNDFENAASDLRSKISSIGEV